MKIWKPIAHVIFGGLVVMLLVVGVRDPNSDNVLILGGISLAFLVAMLIVERVVKTKSEKGEN